MARNRNRYKQMERYMTCTLLADAILFILYLVCAGMGVIWLKVITAILAICVSGLCLAFLHLSRELLRQRSLWMTAASAAIIICILFSLILNYPSPNPYKEVEDNKTADTAAAVTCWECTVL